MSRKLKRLGDLGWLGFAGFLGFFDPRLFFLFNLFFLFFFHMISLKDKDGGRQRESEQMNVEDDSPGALFIPAGVLTGMGVGFLLGNLPVGIFLGLGVGFLIFALYEIFRKKR